MTLERGVFTLSLDFELIWGTLDLFGVDAFRTACRVEREEVLGRLLDLLRRYEVSATWCVLGHLFLRTCPTHNPKHPEIVRPHHPWVHGDWFQWDPGGTEDEAPLFLGRSLVDRIVACTVHQEIGCHSFSHVIFGDPGCTRETAVSEIEACVAVAHEMGLDLRSFAFPRNRVGHLDVLREKGFLCYRGPGPRWYEQDDQAGLLGRLAHLWDVVVAGPPATVLPELTNGLWNVPGSMIYFPRHGIRRWIPVSRRVRRALKGLARAATEKRIFHLWFHPTNLADDTDGMFEGLEAILEAVASDRAAGRLEVLTMGEVARRAAGGLSATGS